ncbi:hypothetical protein [Lacticaseibacillus saniviri]
MQMKKRWLLVMSVLVVVGLGLAACGSGQSSATQSNSKKDGVESRISKKYDKIYGNERKKQESVTDAHKQGDLPKGFERNQYNDIVDLKTNKALLNSEKQAKKILESSKAWQKAYGNKDMVITNSEDGLDGSDTWIFYIQQKGTDKYQIDARVHADGTLVLRTGTKNADGQYPLTQQKTENWFEEGLYK